VKFRVETACLLASIRVFLFLQGSTLAAVLLTFWENKTLCNNVVCNGW
jgi:hypothetical protein